MGGARHLTSGEQTLARSIFRDSIDLSNVTIRRRRWFPFQPAEVAMAPRGHIHFHPNASAYCDDFSTASLGRQALLIHEMTHVWQAQKNGKWWLVTHRHPFCRYDYALRPGWPLVRYGIEQQAEIVMHTFLMRQGRTVAGAPSLSSYEAILPF